MVIFAILHDNEMPSTATALAMINLRKCTQLFVDRIFLIFAFLNGADVCAQATPGQPRKISFLPRAKAVNLVIGHPFFLAFLDILTSLVDVHCYV